MQTPSPFSRWHDPHNVLGTRTCNLVAGDIGGTKSLLAWVTHSPHKSHKILFEQRYDSAAYPDASALLTQFFADAGRKAPPDELCLALPGPVDTGRVRLTNLSWCVDAGELSQALGIPEVRFMNDFQAAAAGVETLQKSDVYTLNAGVPKLGGIRVITGAGTGLGVAWMHADTTGAYVVNGSEGGHVDFSPANIEQCQLLEWLTQRYSGHVSWERLLSGDGVAAIYAYCAERASVPVAANFDAAQVHALAVSNDALAQASIQLFADVYAAWVGNLALLYQARGGVFLAGGVSIHLQNWIKSPRFIEIATAKGRMSSLVQNTPIFLVTNPRLGLLGAMRHT